MFGRKICSTSSQGIIYFSSSINFNCILKENNESFNLNEECIPEGLKKLAGTKKKEKKLYIRKKIVNFHI